MTYDGPLITLAAVTYHTHSGEERGTVIRDVAYLGVIARKSDGFTTLSVRKAGSAKAFNLETGRIISITAHDREWRPQTHPSRWALRAAEIRAFVERAELEDWAKPYFDPQHEKYHRSRSRNEAEVSRPASEPAYQWHGGQPTTARLYDPLAHHDEPAEQPSLLRRLWRRLSGR